MLWKAGSQHFPLASKANNGEVHLQSPKLRWIIHRALCMSTNNHFCISQVATIKQNQRYWLLSIHCVKFGFRVFKHLLIGKIILIRLRLPWLGWWNVVIWSVSTFHCRPILAILAYQLPITIYNHRRTSSVILVYDISGKFSIRGILNTTCHKFLMSPGRRVDANLKVDEWSTPLRPLCKALQALCPAPESFDIEITFPFPRTSLIQLIAVAAKALKIQLLTWKLPCKLNGKWLVLRGCLTDGQGPALFTAPYPFPMQPSLPLRRVGRLARIVCVCK